jgi:UDP-glucose 4-epimerase
MLKVLILGANGFIGKHLVEELSVKENVEITVFGRTAGKDFNGEVRVLEGNFENAEDLQKALANQDIVYHLISQTLPSSSWDKTLFEIEKNLIPTLKLIDFAAACGVKKICFASSGGTVYGQQEKENSANEESPTAPFSPHGIIKRTIESFLHYAFFNHQINYDIYRISNVYGEGQDTRKGLGFINTALENIVRNQPVVIFGDGKNLRDYIYVKDAARLLSLSVTKKTEDSGIYNVSSNRSISLNELVRLIKEVLKIDFEVRYVPDRVSDNQKVVLDNAKILSNFPNVPLVSLEDGIKNTYNYLKKQREF